MTPEQFDRCRDFALRMALKCFAESRRPTQAWIVDHVSDFLDMIESEAGHVVGWDRAPTYLCDRMSDYVADHGFYQVEGAVRDLDRGYELSPGQELAIMDCWQEQWYGPVMCCVRAAIDQVTDSEGVLGFTVGDLHQMYPEGIPSWLGERWAGRLDGAPAETQLVL
jgi:hypothetical protein